MTGRGPKATVGPALLAACIALLALATPVRAEWQAIPAPAGGVRALYAASADSLLALRAAPCCSSFSITADRGATWRSVDLGGFQSAAGLGAAPDGSFRLVSSSFGSGSIQELRVLRVGSAGTVEPLGPLIPTDDGVFGNNSAALDDDGSAWVPFYSDDDGVWRLEIVAADGTSATKELPNLGAERWEARRTAFGLRLVPIGGPGYPSWAARRETYKLSPGGGFELAEAYPVDFADGGFWYSPSVERISWDGGAHWAEAIAESASVVQRNGAPPRFLTTDGGVAERYSPFLYRAAGAPFPAETIFGVVDVGNALVAYNEAALYVESLPLPAPPTAIGAIPADSASLIARADLFRADAGLPPLTGDARISQAAFNHSRYTALNDTEASLSAHYETPGLPGFTGRDLGDRCEAVGVRCFGEVMYAPVADPVGGWLATVFHRFVPGGPEVGLIGGGKVDKGWFVMDSGADRNVLIHPFGYPVGRWRGDEGFHGEIPDPAEICRQNGQPIEYPVGVTVTLFLPERAGVVKKIVVRKRGDSRPLPGCLMTDSESFIPDDPLERGQTYDVHAEWQTNPERLADGTTLAGTTLSYDWSFYFRPDFYGKTKEKRPCRALGLRTIKSVAPARRGGRPHQVLGIEEKVSLKQKAVVRLRRVRLNYWKAGDRHSVRLDLGKLRGRPRRVGRTSFLRLRLPHSIAGRLHPGEEAELRLTFTGRRAKGCKRVVHVSRVRKIEFGWVSVAGPAAWVSAKRKPRHGKKRHSPRG